MGFRSTQDFPDPVNNIRWDILPKPVQSGFLQTTRDRRIAAAVAGVLTPILGALTVTTALCFTATPVVVISVTAGLAFLTLACAATAIALLCLKTSYNDPIYRLKLRQEAGQFLMNNRDLGYEQIRNRYRLEIVGDADINTLLSWDVRNLSYSAFKQKHGLGALYIVDEENKNILREKFMAECPGLHTIRSFEACTEREIFTFSHKEWMEIGLAIAISEATKAGNEKNSYDWFVQRNGEAALHYAKDNGEAFAPVINSFRNQILDKDLGLQQLQSVNYKKQMQPFEKQFEAGLLQEIKDREWRKLIEGHLTYEAFRQRNGADHIQNMIKVDVGSQQVFQYAFLSLPLDRQQTYAADKEWLEITVENQQQILLKKWEGKTLVQLLRDPDFSTSLNREFPASVWKAKALAETQDMSVKDIAHQMPLLFTGGILSAFDGISGQPTIRGRLHQELYKCHSVGDLLSFPAVIFTSNLLNKEEPFFQGLIKQFFKNNLSAYLKNDWKGDAASHKMLLDEYQLVSAELAKQLQAGQNAYNQQKQQYEKVVANTNTVYSSTVQAIEDRVAAQKKQAEDNSGILGQRKIVDETTTNLNALTQDLATQQRECAQLKFSLDKVSETVASHKVRLQELNQQLSVKQQSQPERTLRQAQSLLELKQAEIKGERARIGTNPHLIAFNDKIEDLKPHKAELEADLPLKRQALKASRTLLADFETKSKRLEVLKKEVFDGEFLQKKEKLERKIEKTEVVTGVVNALKAQKQLSADKKSLAAMEAKEKAYDKLSHEIAQMRPNVKDQAVLDSMATELAVLEENYNRINQQFSTALRQRDNLIRQLASNSKLGQLLKEEATFEQTVKTSEAEIKAITDIQTQLSRLNAETVPLYERAQQAKLAYDQATQTFISSEHNKNRLEIALQGAKSEAERISAALQVEFNLLDNQANQDKLSAEQQLDRRMDEVKQTNRTRLSEIEISFQAQLK